MKIEKLSNGLVFGKLLQLSHSVLCQVFIRLRCTLETAHQVSVGWLTTGIGGRFLNSSKTEAAGN